MDKKLEARVARLEGILFNKTVKSEAVSSYDGYSVNDIVCAHNPTDWDYKYKAVIVDIGNPDDLKKKYKDIEDFIYNWYLKDGNVSEMACAVKIVDDEFEDYNDFEYDKNALYLWPIECIAPDYLDVDRKVDKYFGDAVDKLEEAIKFVKSLTETKNTKEHYRRLVKALEYVIDRMYYYWD